jgi:hypothetical protein
MNLPIELVDKILQYDGRMKYRKGEFVNVIHPVDFRYFILEPIIRKKQNILKTMDTASVGHWLNLFSNSNPEFESKRFYFEFEFDTLPGVGLCYDYYWGDIYFEICYYDLRNTNNWKQIKSIIE